MTTKEAIIYESLKLFSINGYESVSTRMIAKAIGASDAVIYKHFKNKQEIFDTIVTTCQEKYFSKRNEVKIETLCWKDVEKICIGMYEFQTTDEWIVMFRKMLIIEQFKNPLMGEIYRETFIDAPVNALSKMFSILIEQGYMKEGNPDVYAMELYAPFFLYHVYEGDMEKIKKNLIDHVTNFRINAVTDICYLE